MSSTSEKLFKGFIELCEELVHDAYVITDGHAVLTATLDHDVAIKLCKLTIRQTGNKNWRVTSLSETTEFAYRTGYDAACQDLQEQISDEEVSSDKLASENGENNEKDLQLRKCEIQHQEKSD